MNDVIICSVCLILAITLFTIAGSQLDYINSQRREMKLISSDTLENAPPSLAFATVAMGAFRGLIVDVLWMRADNLKMKGQFFDAKQLAEWITILQPRFAAVWEFRAWNMAYNISAAIPATQPHQRWRWVRNGYELLRDEGIPLNPGRISLYRNIALIFQHKIGGVTDDVHKYYKIQLAKAMEPLLGPVDNEYFDALAEAPTNFEQIRQDPDINAFVQALRSADQSFDKDDGFVNQYLALRQNPGQFKPEAFRVIDEFRQTQALKKFDIFAKAYHLRNTWKLEPVLMKQINEKYGPIDFGDPNTHLPLDWRHPDVHALYWAIKGFQAAPPTEGFSLGKTNTSRIVGHSLQNLFRYGKIYIYDLSPDEYSSLVSQLNSISIQRIALKKEVYLRPDLRMFNSYNESVMAILEKNENIDRTGTYESFQIGHRNMLENAIFAFYQAGQIPQAGKIYNLLRKLYPREEFNVTLVSFVKKRFLDELFYLGINDAKEMIQMMLRESYFRYAMHDDDVADNREKMAKQVHEYYQQLESDEYRVNLPGFKMMKYLALRDFINDRQYSVSLRETLVGRIKLENPELLEQLKKQAEILKTESQQQQSQ